jgi:hypothetical protein
LAEGKIAEDDVHCTVWQAEDGKDVVVGRHLAASLLEKENEK